MNNFKKLMFTINYQYAFLAYSIYKNSVHVLLHKLIASILITKCNSVHFLKIKYMLLLVEMNLLL